MSPPKIVVIQHVEDSGLGVMAPVLADAGLQLQILSPGPDFRTQLDRDCDGMIILGGPQNAVDDKASPHFPALLAKIQTMHEKGRPLLGICLGGQLLARALGAAVHLNFNGEFGFSKIEACAQADGFPQTAAGLRLMQWHSDSFDIPPKAQHLLAANDCRNQAFILGNSVGLQAHPEVDESIFEQWCELRQKLVGDVENIRKAREDARHDLPKAMSFGRELAAMFAERVNSCCPN